MYRILALAVAFSLPTAALACGMEAQEPSVPLADLMEFIDELSGDDAVQAAQQVGLELPDELRAQNERRSERRRGVLASLRGHRADTDSVVD